MYTHKNSPGSNTELPHNYLQFLRLDPETLSRSLHQTTENIALRAGALGDFRFLARNVNLKKYFEFKFRA